MVPSGSFMEQLLSEPSPAQKNMKKPTWTWPRSNIWLNLKPRPEPRSTFSNKQEHLYLDTLETISKRENYIFSPQ